MLETLFLGSKVVIDEDFGTTSADFKVGAVF